MEKNKTRYGELIEKALEMREKAYAPYSSFSVGAAVLMDDDRIYGGFNIENASFGATNCAERTAIFNALTEGAKKIRALAVVGDLNDFTYPCGICRQVMVEFMDSPDMEVIIVKNKDSYRVHSIKEILPGAFTREDLEENNV